MRYLKAYTMFWVEWKVFWILLIWWNVLTWFVWVIKSSNYYGMYRGNIVNQVHEVQVKLTVEQNVGRHGPLICMLMSFWACFEVLCWTCFSKTGTISATTGRLFFCSAKVWTWSGMPWWCFAREIASYQEECCHKQKMLTRACCSRAVAWSQPTDIALEVQVFTFL